MVNVKDFGAVGDGSANDTAAIQRAIDSGGIVRIPRGVYVTGTLYLKSNGGLHLEAGAVLRRRQMSFLNLRWFMQTLLDRMDRTSMAWGLEARVPFADHRIVEYVYNVPWEMKYQDGMEKKLLRDACKDLLPPELLYRKKSPYPKTYSPVYEALLSERFEQMLQNKQAPIHRFLDNKKAERFLAQPKDYGKPWFGQLMAGPQMLAYFLQVNDWMEMYGIS